MVRYFGAAPTEIFVALTANALPRLGDVMANKTASREWMRKTATATLWPVELATLAGLTRWLAHLLLAKMALASRLPGSAMVKPTVQTVKMNKTAQPITAVKTSFPAPTIHVSDSVVFAMANVTVLEVRTNSIAQSKKNATLEADASTLVSFYPTERALVDAGADFG